MNEFHIITVNAKHEIHVTKNKKIIQKYVGHTDRINDIILVNDRIVTCSDDGTVRMWDRGITFTNPGHVKRIQMLPQNRLFVFGEIDSVSYIRIYNLHDQSLVADFTCCDTFHPIVLSNGRIAYSIHPLIRIRNSDGSIFDWVGSGCLELRDGRLVTFDRKSFRIWKNDFTHIEIELRYGMIIHILQLQNGMLAVIAQKSSIYNGTDNYCYLYDVSKTPVRLSQELQFNRDIHNVVELPDGRLASWNHAYLYISGFHAPTIHTNMIHELVPLMDGTLACCSDTMTRIWDISSNKPTSHYIKKYKIKQFRMRSDKQKICDLLCPIAPKLGNDVWHMIIDYVYG